MILNGCQTCMSLHYRKAKAENLQDHHCRLFLYWSTPSFSSAASFRHFALCLAPLHGVPLCRLESATGPRPLTHTRCPIQAAPPVFKISSSYPTPKMDFIVFQFFYPVFFPRSHLLIVRIASFPVTTPATKPIIHRYTPSTSSPALHPITPIHPVLVSCRAKLA